MNVAPSPGLLVSVRSALEAEAALAGGAALIDVKEPAHGSLGRAEDATIQAVLERVARRRPVSAALGELAGFHGSVPEGLAFVKWGLAGCRLRSTWQKLLTNQWEQFASPQAVVVAYADWQLADAPPLDDVVNFALQRSGNVLLLDTYSKEVGTRDGTRRPTLLDWLTTDEIAEVCRSCRAAGVRVALAGSLGLPEVAKLKTAAPDWIAVRRAVCTAEQRGGVVETERVQALVKLLGEPIKVAMFAG